MSVSWSFGEEFTVTQSLGETIEAAWYAAQANGPEDDVITLLDSASYMIPHLVLNRGDGNITIRAAVGQSPFIEESSNNAAFSNYSDIGEAITLEGAGSTQRMTIRRVGTGSAPIIDCGGAAGNGAFVLRHLVLVHTTDTTGECFLRLNNNAVTHTLEDISLIGAVSADMIEVGSLQLNQSAALKPAVTIEGLSTANADCPTQIFQIHHPVLLNVHNSQLTPIGACAVLSQTLYSGVPMAEASEAFFRDCSLRTGDAAAFENLGLPEKPLNEYHIIRPQIVGKVGESFIFINPGTTACVYISGSNDDGSAPAAKTDISSLGAYGTNRIARMLAGKIVLEDLSSTNLSAHIDTNNTGALTGDIAVKMHRCQWMNCGTLTIDPTSALFEPAPSAAGYSFEAVNTTWQGGSIHEAWLDTNGAATGPGAITLTHCTFMSVTASGASPFIEGHTGDTVLINASIFAGGNASGACSNLPASGTLPNLFYWKDTDTNNAGPGMDFTGDVIVQPPSLNSYLVPNQDSPALSAAAGSTFTEDINGSLRPVPCGSDPDLGAIEVDHDAPTATVTLNGDTLTNGDTLSYTIIFSECVTGFDDVDIRHADTSDLISTTLSGNITYSDFILTGGPTEYTVTYTGVTGDGTLALGVRTCFDSGSIRDLAGNMLIESTPSAVVTFDHTPPVLSLNGLPMMAVQCAGTPYEEPGAVWTDAVDGSGAVPAENITGDIINNEAGTTGNIYTLYYAYTDQAGNSATTIHRQISVIDTLSPVISIDGGLSEIQGECHEPITIPGAQGADLCVGALPVTTILDPGLTPENPTEGTYTVTYTCSDSEGNPTTEYLSVTIDDTTPPSLQNVPGPFILKNTDQNGLFTFSDAKGSVSASDSCAPENPVVYITATLGETPVSFPINLNSGPYPKVYTLHYQATDDTGLSATAETTLTVNENELPVLTLTGENPQIIDCPTPYVYDGYSVSDAESPTEDLVVSITGEVLPEVPGDYPLIYRVSDPLTAKIVQQERIVRVVDATPPNLTLVGSSEVTVECHSTYNDAGATAWDACMGGDVSGGVQIVNPVNTQQPGNYIIDYLLSDGYNTTTIHRMVHVVDTTPPVLTLNGASYTVISCKGSFSDPGCTASDSCGGNLTSKIIVSGKVNTLIPGLYTLTYSVKDASGNPASPVTRQVRVTDTAPPMVYISGANPKLILAGSNYTLPTATAYDFCAGTLAAHLTDMGDFDINRPGVYRLTYTSDPDGAGLHGTATLTIQVAAPLAITPEDPVVLSVNQGETLAMEVNIENAIGELSYQWLFEEADKSLTPIAAGNGPKLEINPVDAADAGVYFCEVTDPVTGSVVQSAPFTLTVIVKTPTVPLLNLTGLILLMTLLTLAAGGFLKRDSYHRR